MLGPGELLVALDHVSFFWGFLRFVLLFVGFHVLLLSLFSPRLLLIFMYLCVWPFWLSVVLFFCCWAHLLVLLFFLLSPFVVFLFLCVLCLCWGRWIACLIFLMCCFILYFIYKYYNINTKKRQRSAATAVYTRTGQTSWGSTGRIETPERSRAP